METCTAIFVKGRREDFTRVCLLLSEIPHPVFLVKSYGVVIFQKCKEFYEECENVFAC